MNNAFIWYSIFSTKKKIYEFQMNIYQLYNYPQSLPCNKYCEL